MTTHEPFMELAAAALDFDLAAAERAELEQHLATCVSCRRRTAALQADARAISSLPLLAVPTRVQAWALGRRSSRSPLGLSRTLALAAALALLGLAGIIAAGEMLRRTNDQQLVDARSPQPTAAEPTEILPSPSPTGTPSPTATPPPPVASSLCGQVGGSVFYVGSDVNPSIRESVTIGGETFATSDFQVGVLSVLELAWVSHQDVCVERLPGGPPEALTAHVDACGDVINGATWWLFEGGAGVVGPDNQDDLKLGTIHDTLLGFRFLDVSADAQPPNLESELELANLARNGRDCLTASVDWAAGSDAIIEAELTTAACVNVTELGATAVRLASEDLSESYPFQLTGGSTLDPAFDLDELGGAQVTAGRGLDGAVTILPVAVDGCPDALATAQPDATFGIGP
jgi:hypothetical protein